tara:strand:+ start:4682 stop:8545 length:3864 start_codon:yes stop_codon:yes gene_type:complete
MQINFYTNKFLAFIIVFILLSCQNPDENKWVTFEPKNETEIYNEPASTENKESQPLNQSTTTIQNDKVIVNKPNFHPESHFAMLSDWLRINQFLSDNKSIRTTAENLSYKGFDLELHYPHPRQSLRLESKEGTFSTKTNQSGTYHIAALIYDNIGAETFELSINKKFIGSFTANSDNNKEYLFLTTTDFELEENDDITFSSKIKNGVSPSFSHFAHRVEEIIIIPTLNSIPKSTYKHEIRNITLNQINLYPYLNKNNLHLTWITNWKTKCFITVDYDNLDTKTIHESNQWNNHRIIIPLETEKSINQVKLNCESLNGEVTSDWIIPDKNKNPVIDVNYSTSFSVNNPSEFEYNMKPITISIPIPKSKWWGNSFVLLDKNNNPHIFQSSPLSYWEDGSIKWVLIEFLSNIKPNKEKTFFLSHTSTSLPDKNDSICVEAQDSVVLNNGKVKLELSSSNSPLDSIYFDINSDGYISSNELMSKSDQNGIISIVSDTGDRYYNQSISNYRVLRNGPISCIISVKSIIDYHKGTQIESDFQIEMYKNQNWIGFESTVGFNSPTGKTRFKSIDLNLPIEDGDLISNEIGIGKSDKYISNQNIELIQAKDDHWILNKNGTIVSKGTKAPGWANANFETHQIKLSVKDFWQQWPKSISVNQNALTVGLFPQIDKDWIKPSDNIELTKLLYHFDNDSYIMPSGLRKTHKLTLSFGGINSAHSKTLKLQGKVDPKLIVNTGVIGSVAEFNPHKFPLYDSIFNEMLNSRLLRIKNNREYGILNFGDWWGEREVNWGNNEYDTPHGLFQNWLLGGPDVSFNLAVSAVTHMQNIDVVNQGPADQVGKMYKHSIGHLGNWFKEPIQDEKLKKGFYKSHHSSGHTWIDGLLDHYYLTGDISSFSTAMKIADNLASYETINYDFTTAREIGSFLLVMASAYKATNDEFYLNAATIGFERLIQRENLEKGGWDRILTSYECNLNPPQLGEKSFMTGLLLSGLKQYHILTRNSKASDMIIDASSRIINENWNDKLRGFKYSSCDNSPSPTDLNWIILEGLGYSWELTNNLKFAHPILQNLMLRETFKDSKGFSLSTRFAQQILHNKAHAQNNLFNVYSEKNTSFNLSSKKREAIISFSSNNTKTDNFSIILSNNQNDSTKMIDLINGFASTVLNTENDIVYKIRIHSRDRSGINILSDSTKLNLIISDEIVLLGQKAIRTFWLNLPGNDAPIDLNLRSPEIASIKLIDSNGKLIEKCQSNSCQLTLDIKQDNINSPIRIEIQNNNDATLTIDDGPTLISAFANQL